MYLIPKPISHQNTKLTQQHNWKKGSSSPRVASVSASSRCRRRWCVCTVSSTYVAISVWYSTSPSKVAWRKKGKNQVPTSYITRFAVEFFLSYESLKSRKRRICFPTSYKSTYVAIPAIRPFCHSFCHSAIPSTIPPFRHSAIPPFCHFYYSYV